MEGRASDLQKMAETFAGIGCPLIFWGELAAALCVIHECNFSRSET